MYMALRASALMRRRPWVIPPARWNEMNFAMSRAVEYIPPAASMGTSSGGTSCSWMWPAGTVRVRERFGLIECARRHPQRLEQFLAHQPWERLPRPELEGIADQVISQVGIAEAFPHPALQPGVGDAPDVLIERAVPVAVIVADRGLVTKARPMTEQVTKRDLVHLRFTPPRMDAEPGHRLLQWLVERQSSLIHGPQERRGGVGLGNRLKAEGRVRRDPSLSGSVRETESPCPDNRLVIDEGHRGTWDVVLGQEFRHVALQPLDD